MSLYLYKLHVCSSHQCCNYYKFTIDFWTDADSLTPAKSAASKCPFLKQNQMLESITEASEGVQDDVIVIGSQAKKTEIKEGEF